MFAEALAAFRNMLGRCGGAVCGCTESLPGDGPSTFYMRLCEQTNHPPAETWDGVVNMDVK